MTKIILLREKLAFEEEKQAQTSDQSDITHIKQKRPADSNQCRSL